MALIIPKDCRYFTSVAVCPHCGDPDSQILRSQNMPDGEVIDGTKRRVQMQYRRCHGCHSTFPIKHYAGKVAKSEPVSPDPDPDHVPAKPLTRRGRKRKRGGKG